MPCFRGVDVSIVTQPGSKKLPEYPHSDASSVQILPPGRLSGPSDSGSVLYDPSSPRIQKVSPRVSVYVPSEPGAQFGVHYSVAQMPEPPCHLYFKIFMNGRNITNCGTNPAVHASGSITRALCEPSDRWHYKEHGMVHKRDGIEARGFYFLPISKKTSVADDGGLIEVQVFRAKGRKRRAPILPKHRNQEPYGIASPSGGLLESPEEACYYDWVLIDPKEFPFVSFRFHYRSLSNLRLLNLAPAFSELNKLSPPVEERRRKTATGISSQDDETSDDESTASSSAKCGQLDDPGDSELDEDLPRLLQDSISSNRSLFDGKGPMLMPPHSSVRPLPEIPAKKLVPKKSFESCAPSIAPSLLPYIEEDPTEAEDVEFGMATEIPVRSDSLRGSKPRLPILDSIADGLDPLLLPKRRGRSVCQESLAVSLKHVDLSPRRASDTPLEGLDNKGRQVRNESAPKVVSMVEETEMSFKAGWTLSEGEWMKRVR
ncbi:hypothetical protein FZEAL_3256 [Fusarium zealandicum]|uniref:Uncharacterized protein n=1 Tax=Fusarium zealandicum TaxID=1053134 RepID=A0A8H4UP47_9HYPO|nr:hypothetical protein FZEAL_3256 [Fusarium zealandicum]